MRLTHRFLVPVGVVAALAFGVAPALAQHHAGGGGGGGAVRTRGGGSGARAGASAAVPHGSVAVPRSAVVPRGVAVPRVGGPLPYYRGPVYRGYGYGLPTPYYAFRPRLGLGVGLWLGYPVVYPYWAYPTPYVYGYPYAYQAPYSYPADPYQTSGYTPQDYSATLPSAQSASPYTVQVDPQASTPGTAPVAPQTYGGLSFQITPGTAEVFVDGMYVGTAGQFGASMQPLTLTPGRHRVEIRAEGYQTIAFEASVVGGQVMPYQGAMQPR